ncbi:hypothetical protein BDV10DRAFT_77555 [Aspergillus recurvatus]
MGKSGDSCIQMDLEGRYSRTRGRGRIFVRLSPNHASVSSGSLHCASNKWLMRRGVLLLPSVNTLSLRWSRLRDWSQSCRRFNVRLAPVGVDGDITTIANTQRTILHSQLRYPNCKYSCRNEEFNVREHQKIRPKLPTPSTRVKRMIGIRLSAFSVLPAACSTHNLGLELLLSLKSLLPKIKSSCWRRGTDPWECRMLGQLQPRILGPVLVKLCAPKLLMFFFPVGWQGLAAEAGKIP